jgi:GNAT superfamily N-acetyltransferase
VTARIRPLELADRPAVSGLIEAVLAEFGFTVAICGVDRDLAEVVERYGRTGDDGVAAAGFWVAEIDGAVVGTVAVRAKEGQTCELKRLYLRLDQRGAGLGQSLYEHAETFARGAGYARVWLTSSRRFARAHRLYQRNGFGLVESLDNEWEDDVYEKWLR